jgi:hypothetical protein
MRDCLIVRRAGAACDWPGCKETGSHLPMKRPGRWCSVHCPACGKAPEAEREPAGKGGKR